MQLNNLTCYLILLFIKGKGANQAVACARLGIKTRMCGLVGNDEYGKDYKTQLMNEKVSVSDVRVSESKSTTAIACINVGTDNGSNTIVIIPGVLNEFKFDDNIRCHIQNSKLLLCQNEILFETTKKALEIARESQIISIFNPAPVSNDCINLCRLADIVCPNESELSLLTNMPTDTDEEIAIAANNLLRMSNAKAILVTLGAKGAYLCSSKFKEFIPTKIVNAVDTVGAGDCFIGTLASYIVRLNDDDLDDVVSVIQKALSCASVSVTRFGAQKSYMFLDELEDNLKPKIMTKTDDIYSKSLFYHSICKRFE